MDDFLRWSASMQNTFATIRAATSGLSQIIDKAYLPPPNLGMTDFMRSSEWAQSVIDVTNTGKLITEVAAFNKIPKLYFDENWINAVSTPSFKYNAILESVTKQYDYIMPLTATMKAASIHGSVYKRIEEFSAAISPFFDYYTNHIDIVQQFSEALEADLEAESSISSLSLQFIFEELLYTGSVLIENYKNGRDCELLKARIEEFFEGIRKNGLTLNVLWIFYLLIAPIYNLIADDTKVQTEKVYQIENNAIKISLQQYLYERPDGRSRRRILIPENSEVNIIESSGAWIKVTLIVDNFHHEGWIKNGNLNHE